MATVVTVSDALWQAAVSAMVEVCDVAMIDITEPRAHICWELRTLRDANARIVLLAQREGLASWWHEPCSPDEDPAVAELRELAKDLPLVVYESPDRIEEVRLARLMLSRSSVALS